MFTYLSRLNSTSNRRTRQLGGVRLSWNTCHHRFHQHLIRFPILQLFHTQVPFRLHRMWCYRNISFFFFQCMLDSLQLGGMRFQKKLTHFLLHTFCKSFGSKAFNSCISSRSSSQWSSKRWCHIHVKVSQWQTFSVVLLSPPHPLVAVYFEFLWHLLSRLLSRFSPATPMFLR